MNQLKNVFTFEFMEMLKRKTVVISTVVIAVVGFALTFAPRLLGNDSSNESSYDNDYSVYLNSGIVIDNDELKDVRALFSKIEGVVILENEEAIEKALEDKTIATGFLVKSLESYTFYSHDEDVYNSDRSAFESILSKYVVDTRLEEANINPLDVYAAMDVQFQVDEVITGKKAANGMFIAFAILFIMYMLILLYGQSVATSVAREKDSRTMELLITSTKPKVLILGKVFAVGLLGILQISIILLGFYLGYIINKGSYPEMIVTLIGGALNLKSALVYIVFSTSGYILYLFIYAALGSLVSKVEDVNSVVQPITYIFFIAYMIASFAMQMPASGFVKISSYIPFISMFTMPIRNMLTTVSTLEILISLIIMIGTTWVMALSSIYIYRFGSLNYGNKIKLKHVLKSLKQSH